MVDPTTTETIVRVIQMSLAGIAATVNLYAAVKGAAYRRALFAVTGVLAAIYAAGYLYVLVTENVEQFQEVFRGVNIVSWSVVWLGPALMHLRSRKKIQRHINEELVSTAESAIEEAQRVRERAE